MRVTKSELLNNLTQMNEYDFEHLVADLWTKLGWQTTVTGGSGDRGIDITAEKGDPFYQKHLIQVKRYSRENKVSSSEIQLYSSLRQQEDTVDAVVLVTTSSYTEQARQRSEDLNVKIISGIDLYHLVSRYGGEDLLEKYFTFTDQDEEEEQTETTATEKSSSSSDETSESNDGTAHVTDADIDQDPVTADTIEDYENEVKRFDY